MKLTCERRLVGVAALLRHDADRRIGPAQTIARPSDPGSREVLSGRKPKKGSNTLIELEYGEPGSLREIRNSQRGVEIVMDVTERRGQRRNVGLRARQIRDVAGDAGEPD